MRVPAEAGWGPCLEIPYARLPAEQPVETSAAAESIPSKREREKRFIAISKNGVKSFCLNGQNARRGKSICVPPGLGAISHRFPATRRPNYLSIEIPSDGPSIQPRPLHRVQPRLPSICRLGRRGFAAGSLNDASTKRSASYGMNSEWRSWVATPASRGQRKEDVPALIVRQSGLRRS